MHEDILHADDLGADIPLNELHVTDLPRRLRRQRHTMRLPGRRWRVIALLTMTLVVVMAMDILWGPQMLTLLAAQPAPVTIPTLAGNTPMAITGASNWQKLALPVADTLIEWLGASPGDPKQIYACAGTSYSSSSGTITGQPTLWATNDAGTHWQVIHQATTNDVWCFLSFDSANSQHMALYEEDRSDATQTPCAGTLSLSTDSGSTWQSRIVTPVHTASRFQTVYCELTVTARHVYIAVDFTNNAPTTQQHREYTLLLRSDDAGASWHDSTPTHIDGVATTSWPLLISDDTLIGRVDTQHTNSIIQTRWQSQDAGNHWRQTATNSPLFFDFIFDVPGIATALYGINGFAPPSRFFVTHALYSATGEHWAYLPALPVSNSSAEHPGIFSQLGVTTQGNLLVVGIGNGINLPFNKDDHLTSQNVPLTIWEWDRTQQRWLYLATPLPLAEPTSCGGCFQSSLSHGLSPDGTKMGTSLLLRTWYPSSVAWGIFIPDLP